MKSNLRKLMAVLLTVALLWTTVIPAFAEDVLVPEEDVIFAEPVDEAFEEVGEDLGNGLTAGDEDEQELTYEGQEAADEVAEEVVEQPIEADPVDAADAEYDPNDYYLFYVVMKSSTGDNAATITPTYGDKADSTTPKEKDPNLVTGYEATYNGKTQKPEIELYAYNVSTKESTLVKDEGITSYTYSWYLDSTVTEPKDANASSKFYKVGGFKWVTPINKAATDDYTADNSVFVKYPVKPYDDRTGTWQAGYTDGDDKYNFAITDTLVDGKNVKTNKFTIKPVHLVVKITKDVNVSNVGAATIEYAQADLPYEIENLPTDETEAAKIIKAKTAFNAYAKLKDQTATSGKYTLDTTTATEYTIVAESATKLNSDALLDNETVKKNYTFVDYATEYPEEAEAEGDAVNTKKLTVVDYVITSHNDDAAKKWKVEYDADGIDTTSAAAIIEAFGIKIKSGDTDVTNNFQFTFKETEVKDVGKYHLTIASEALACAPVEQEVEIVKQPVLVTFNASDLVVKYNGETQVPVYTAVDKDGNAVEMEIDASGTEYNLNTEAKLLNDYIPTGATLTGGTPKEVRKKVGNEGDKDYVSQLNHPQTLGAYTLTFKPVSENYRLYEKGADKDGADVEPYAVTKKDQTEATKTPTVPFVITKREVIVTGLKTSSKVYNGEIDALADVSAVKFLDAADGTTEITDETLKLSVKGSKAVYEDANAGTGKTVYFKLALDGDAATLPYILVNNTKVSLKKVAEADRTEKLELEAGDLDAKGDSAELAPIDDELKLYKPIYTTTDGVITPIQVKLAWKDEATDAAAEKIYTKDYQKDASGFALDTDAEYVTKYLNTPAFTDPVGGSINSLTANTNLKFGFAAQENGPALVKVDKVELPVNAGKYNLVVSIKHANENASDKDKAAFAANFEIVNPTHEIEVEPIYGFIGIELDMEKNAAGTYQYIPLYYDKNGAEPTFKVWWTDLSKFTAAETLEQKKAAAQEAFGTFLQRTDKTAKKAAGSEIEWTELEPNQYELEYVNNTGVNETVGLNATPSVAEKPGEKEERPYILVTADPNNDPNNLCIAYKVFNIEKLPLIVSNITAENKTYDGTPDATLNVEYDEGAVYEGDVVEITAKGAFMDAAGTNADANVVLKKRTSEPDEKTVKVTKLSLNEDADKLYRLYAIDYNKTTKKDVLVRLTLEAEDTINYNADAHFGGDNYKGFEIKAIIDPLVLDIEWENYEGLVYGDGKGDHKATFKVKNWPTKKDDEGNWTEEVNNAVILKAEGADATPGNGYTIEYFWVPDEKEADPAKHAGDWRAIVELGENVVNYLIDGEQAELTYNIAKKPVTAKLVWALQGTNTEVDTIRVDDNVYSDHPITVYTGKEIDAFTLVPNRYEDPLEDTIKNYYAKLSFTDENGKTVEQDKVNGIYKSDEDDPKDFYAWYDPDNINVGWVNFGVNEEENGNYTFESQGLSFEIEPATNGALRLEYGWDTEEYEVMEDDWTQVVDQTYTGKPIELEPWVALLQAKDKTRVENGKVVHYTDWEPVDITEDDFAFEYINVDAEDEDDADDTTSVGHIVVRVVPTGNYNFTALDYLGYNIVPKKVTPVVKVESPVTYDPYGQYVDYTVTDEDGNEISFLEYDATSGYEGTKVGKYNLVLTDAEGGNYELTFNKEGYAWEIVPAEAELVWANTELNYNGKAQKPTATVKGNTNVTVTVTGEQTDAGKYTATASALSDSNYKLPEKNTAEFSIAKLEVTVSNITAASKIEDGTKTATIDASNATFAGLLSGDELKIEKATGEFVTAAPGKDKTVTLKYELAGKSAKNYTLSSGSQKTATATITAKAIIEVDKADRDYLIEGDTLPLAIYKDANGKELGFAEVTLVEPAKLNGVGTYKAIAKLPATEKDYVADPVSFEFKVVPHEVSVTWITDTFTYNGTAQGPAAIVIADTSAYTVTGDTATDAGSYTATVTLKDTKNYVFAKDAKTTQAYTIAKRPVTIAGITANDKVEDGTNTAEIVTSGASFTGKLEKDTLTVTATGAFKDAAVGNGKEIPLTLTLSGADAKNYTIADGSQKVTKANITAKPAQPSGTLILRTLSSGKDALKLKWKLMQNVDGYEIKYQKSSLSAKKAPVSIIDVVGNTTYRYVIKNLDEKTLYKVWIRAYVMKDGKKQYVRTSPMTRSFTGYGTEKYTNAARLRVNTTVANLTVKGTQKITATVIGKDTSKKLEPKSAALRYLSTDVTVAKVSKDGTITGVKAGTCDVYVLSGNGLSKRVAVTVK